jgi:copper(I)-binding protein
MRSSRPSWPRTRSGFLRVSLAAGVLAVAATACGSPAGSQGSLVVRDAWIRLPVAGTSAGYLVIENGTGAAEVLESASIAGASVTLHRTVTDASGMTGMQMVDAIHIPAGGTVELAPGGFHLMIEGLPASLAVGDHVALALVFAGAGGVTVQAEVRGS